MIDPPEEVILPLNEQTIPLPRTPWAVLCAQYGLNPNLPGLTGIKLYGGFSNRLLARVERAANGTDYAVAYTPLGVRALAPQPPFKRIRGPKRRSSRRLAVQRKRAAQGLPPDGKIPGWTRRQTRIVAGVVPPLDIRIHVARMRVQQYMARTMRTLDRYLRGRERRERQAGIAPTVTTSLRRTLARLAPLDESTYQFVQAIEERKREAG
jgi:hypothetical protein